MGDATLFCGKEILTNQDGMELLVAWKALFPSILSPLETHMHAPLKGTLYTHFVFARENEGKSLLQGIGVILKQVRSI